jgi:peptide-methionine (S)-S-oxide reductase
MNRAKLVVGGGCFWCVEAVFADVKGVLSAVSGYSGGSLENPTYEEVCTGATGHAEIVDISYDSDVISLEELLNIFFVIHNPTTLNSQGADRGTQYRSVVYYETLEEKERIWSVIAKQQNNFRDTIVTEVSQLGRVYRAEGYHQNYYKLNPYQGYCQVVIAPKVQKFMSTFPDKLV